ncbi:hypothetical protein MRX96_002422 [Rhipicephalus microplus]
MARAMGSSVLFFKGFNDVLEGRPVQPVNPDLPVGMLACSLCSVVAFEHFSLRCKHSFCVVLLHGNCQKTHHYQPPMPRRRQVLSTAKSTPEVHHRSRIGARLTGEVLE